MEALIVWLLGMLGISLLLGAMELGVKVYGLIVDYVEHKQGLRPMDIRTGKRWRY